MTRTLFFWLAALGLLAPAYGQVICPPRQPQPGFKQPTQRGPKLDKFEADGTLVGMVRGRIMLQTITNQRWWIHFKPDTVVYVRGKAEADFLRPGLCIQFDAEIDRRGRSQEKITHLTITTPSVSHPMGCWPEGTLMPGMGPAAGGGAAGFGAGNVAPAKPARTKPPATQRYTVHGQISKLKNGKMTIVAPGGTKVEAELGENVDIDVAIADVSVARAGDRVTVKGGMPKQMAMLRPGMIGNAQANAVEIELQKPLTGPRKKPIRKPLPKKPAEKPAGKDAGKAEGEPAAEAVEPPPRPAE